MKRYLWFTFPAFIFIFGMLASIAVWGTIPQTTGEVSLDVGMALYAWLARLVTPLLTIFGTWVLFRKAVTEVKKGAK